PARTKLHTGPQWSRPPFALTLGVRPNSPMATTSVSCNSPRCSRSSTRAVKPTSKVGASTSSMRSAFWAWVSHRGLSTALSPGSRGHCTWTSRTPRLDEPPCQQGTLAEPGPAVALPDFRRLLLDGKGLAGLARQEQLEGPLLEGVELANGVAAL